MTAFLLFADQHFPFICKGHGRGLRPGKRPKLPFAGFGGYLVSGKIEIGSTKASIFLSVLLGL